MAFDENVQEWKIWIGHDVFGISSGMDFEICIDCHYYKAIFEKDYFDWFVTTEDDIGFSLRLVETYKVRVQEKKLTPIVDLPF